MADWAGIARRVIGRALAEGRALGLDGDALVRHVDAAYPFRSREFSPYRRWLEARRSLLGALLPPAPSAALDLGGCMGLFDHPGRLIGLTLPRSARPRVVPGGRLVFARPVPTDHRGPALLCTVDGPVAVAAVAGCVRWSSLPDEDRRDCIGWTRWGWYLAEIAPFRGPVAWEGEVPRYGGPWAVPDELGVAVDRAQEEATR